MSSELAEKGELSPEAGEYLKELRNPENVPIEGDPNGLTPREKAVAELTLLAPPETRKTLKEVGDALDISYEVARNARKSAAAKLRLKVSDFNMPRGQKCAEPGTLSELEEAMINLTVRPESSQRISVADAARELGVDFQAAYNARNRGLDKLDLDWRDYRAPRSNGEQRTLMNWDDDIFVVIAFADPTFAMNPAVVCHVITSFRTAPEHLVRGLIRFRRRTPAARLALVRRAQATAAAWRQRYHRSQECLMCADLATRRPCPGVCPVCRKPGARELLERPETLHSSAGLIENEE